MYFYWKSEYYALFLWLPDSKHVTYSRSISPLERFVITQRNHKSVNRDALFFEVEL